MNIILDGHYTAAFTGDLLIQGFIKGWGQAIDYGYYRHSHRYKNKLLELLLFADHVELTMCDYGAVDVFFATVGLR